VIGVSAVFAVGLLFCLFVRRTGNLWFPIGFHAGWDWAETYFYGVPDSGTPATGQLFHSSLHGPSWLTGGTVGPEGSLLCFIAIVIMGLLFGYAYRKRLYQPEAQTTFLDLLPEEPMTVALH
jgi:membrane protease YdiL (CAAX protease family)